MTAESMVTLAAILYETGFPIDRFVVAVATTLRAEGVRLAGVIQENTRDAETSCSAMSLVDLKTGGRFGISQDLGPNAQDCRLDPRGLAEVEVPLAAAIKDSVDLVILNKFGKTEAEGGGLRSTLARAIELGVPVLTAVRPPYTETWSGFHGGLAIDLIPDQDVVLAWCRRAVRERNDARRSIATAD